MATNSALRCSFCNSGTDTAGNLVASNVNPVAICGDCLVIGLGILLEGNGTSPVLERLAEAVDLDELQRAVDSMLKTMGRALYSVSELRRRVEDRQ